jgi:uncharacterized OsmC-like protein
VGVAREFDLDLKSVRVRVVHKQNMLGIGPDNPKQRSLKITELRRHIEVKGDLDEEAQKKLLWGAEHCPISNTIEGLIPVTTRLEVVSDE